MIFLPNLVFFLHHFNQYQIHIERVVILEQPESAFVKQGSKIRLEVRARGDPAPKYQWYRNDILLYQETRSVLQMEDAGSHDEASYHCVVMNGDDKVRLI